MPPNPTTAQTSTFVRGSNNSYDSLQDRSTSQDVSEAAVQRHNRDRRLYPYDTRFDVGDHDVDTADDTTAQYVRSQAQRRMPAELQSEQAGRVTAFHVPRIEVGDVTTIPNDGDWRIKNKRVYYRNGNLLDSLVLQAP